MRLKLLSDVALLDGHHASAAPRLRAAAPHALAAEVAHLRAELYDLRARFAAAMNFSEKPRSPAERAAGTTATPSAPAAGPTATPSAPTASATGPTATLCAPAASASGPTAPATGPMSTPSAPAASATGPTAFTPGAATADALWIESNLVYTGVVRYDWREGNSVVVVAVDHLQTELLAFNQRFGDIDADKIIADLIDYKNDESLLQAETGVRFTYCQQGSGTDLNVIYSVLGLLAPATGLWDMPSLPAVSAKGPTATPPTPTA